MLKGTRPAIIKRIQPVSIHGQVSLEIAWADPEAPEDVHHSRVGPEVVPRRMDVGDRVTLHFVMGMVTEITKEPPI